MITADSSSALDEGQDQQAASGFGQSLFADRLDGLMTLLPALIDGINSGVVIIDRDHRVFASNKFAQDWVKRSAEEIRGQPCHKLFHNSEEACADCAATTTFRTGERAQALHTGSDGKGGLYYAQTTTYPIKDERGEILYVIEHAQDISERVHFEQESAALLAALQESEERYRQLVELSNDLIWTLDSSGNFVWFNRRAEEVSGYRLDELVGKTFAPMILPEDLPMVQRMFFKTLAGEPCSYEVRVRRNDGSVFVLLVNTAPMISKGQVLGTASFGSDITDRKRAEEQLLRRNTELEVLNAVAVAAGKSLNLTEVLEASLESVLRGLGLRPSGGIFLLDEAQQWLQLTVHRGLSADFVRQESRVKVGECLCGRVARSGRLIFSRGSRHDPRHTRQQETSDHAHLVVPLKAQGKTVGVMFLYPHQDYRVRREDLRLLESLGAQIGVAIDNARLYEREGAATAELRASEERYRDLFENANDFVYVLDTTDSLSAVNHAALAITGYSREELVGRPFGQLLDEPSRTKLHQVCRQIHSGGWVPQPFEIGILTKESRRAILETSLQPIVENGMRVGVQGIARDVTEQRRLQEQLRSHLQGVIRAREDERRNLARDLHDDTAQNLVAIGRLVDTLMARGQCDCAEHLDEIRRLADKTMADVRRFAKELRPSLVDDLGLLPALEGLVAEINRRGPVRITLQVKGRQRRLPDEVELMLFRIAQEALNNVIRHAEACSAMVEVEILPNRVRLAVRDDGKGFEFQEDGRNFAAEGKLGLVGMRERAELIDGTLEMGSSPGQGTRIEVKVPC